MKIKVEIWSDVACPFCFIGKKRLEQAVNEAGLEANVEVQWKSFQLNPELRTNTQINIHQYLSEVKGISETQAKSMNAHLTGLGKSVGIDFDFDKVVVANTHQAHLLIQFAFLHGKQNEIEEALFTAYFNKGANIDDVDVLKNMAQSVGLNYLPDDKVLEEMVQNDMIQAKEIGISGVPFFVFNRQYAISGAQETSVFLSAFQKLTEKTGHDV